MKPRPAVICLLLVALSLPMPAQSAAAAVQKVAPASGELPIRRVVLYKNGVGYFEHQTRVNGNQELKIRFSTAQLNDVLKSLTVVDLGGGKVGGVRYNSTAPLRQRLGTLRLGLDGNTDRAGFLNALRGARVEVRSGTASAIGRLLSVEEITRQDKDGNELKTTQLSVLSEAGELRSFDLNSATSVKILEGEMAQEAGRYMSLLASARDKDVRQMTIPTSGEGAREVVISYISEVPVWKSTYRIVLPQNPQSKPLLQGWAVIDNTVGEDWKDVQLSLVAGAPQSFIQPISQPFYVRRPVVELPKSAQLTPQTHEGGESQPTLEISEGVVAGIPGGSSGGVIGGVLGAPKTRNRAGYGGGSTTVEASAVSPEVSTLSRNIATDTAEASFEAQSKGETLGDMFEYALKQPVTVLQNQSALVPIVQSRVEAEKVTLWNASEPAPMRALWLSNSSGLTLDAGSFNIVEGGAFAGEGLLTEIHPNERRLLSYAADTAVRVHAQGSSEQRPYTRIRAAHGVLILTRELRETRTYTVTNSDTAPRSVILEHPARNGWHFLDPALKPAESSTSFHRFRLAVAPGTTERLAVAEYYPQETTYALRNIGGDFLAMLLKSGTARPEVETALRRLIARKDAIAALEREIKDRKDEIERIGQEQARIRQNMQALKGSAEEKALVQRYVASLNQQEDRLAKLNAEISAKEVELSARQSEYQLDAESITFDQHS